MFIIDVMKNEDADHETYVMALNCARESLISLLEDDNLIVSVDEVKKQIIVSVLEDHEANKLYTLHEFKELNKQAFMGVNGLYPEFKKLKVFAIE
ncbi:hypothetical protein PVK64_20025 [Aliivibrio sp. S4TY2]|uniref:hypothetical protein n=1 Tax=unclassified Aliivibrio TaxID=2645654 RepID=UPI0023787CFD|nr:MULTISPECIES: hypothetical protein [unclassified Aliivibrio]MDD9158454.1 hypothetical protein [Aliivibrio sp. S4TY2]MDD9162448.1 hypothetical protein [Aliivibrio sp. S4TY1]MDD9166461.1 hypothetical protein [Aliivibrio sp. S4MY2]MDD9170459.1 hypothetical protein [Aliivibrio sp. S4MY4]MDD9187540.1 hypothetical protein [Aliivibrio sp. S4MY3]